MNPEESNQYEQIQRYLDAALSDEERKKFEQQLKSDKKLEELVLLQKKLKRVLNSETTIRNTLSVIRTEEEAISKRLKPQKRNRKIFRFMGIAASILLIAVAIWFFLPSTTQNNFGAFHKHNQISLNQKSGTTTNLSKLEELFNKANYKECLEKIKPSWVEELKDMDVWLIQGIAQYETKQYKEALRSFDHIIQSDALIQGKANWYKAGVLLEMKKIDDAKIILEQIIKDKTFQFREAEKILMTLKER